MRTNILLFLVSQMSLCASLMIHKSYHSQHYKKTLTRRRATVEAEYALLFDCDGVIVETEELHRLAYNEAFKIAGVKLPSGEDVIWTVPYYDILQNTVGGGKPKMMHYFNNEVKVWPSTSSPAVPSYDAQEERVKLVDYLQDLKTGCYKAIIEEVASARPGVLELMDAAIADPRLKVGICSAATKAGFEKLVNKIVGPERLAKLDCVIAGDDVSLKKPDPMIYNTAQKLIGIPADRCVVIEDSIVGLKAAKGAGMRCIITYTDSTATEDFYGLNADAKVPNLAGITVEKIFGPSSATSELGEILANDRDSKHATPAPVEEVHDATTPEVAAAPVAVVSTPEIVPEVAAAPVAVVSTPEIVPEVAAAPVAVVSTPEIVPEVAAAPVAVVSTPEIVPEVAAAPVAVVSTPEIVPEVAAAPVAVVSTPEIVPEVAAAPVAVVSTPEIVPEVAAAPVAVVSTPEIVPEVAAAPVAVVSTPEIVPEVAAAPVAVVSTPEIVPEVAAAPVAVVSTPEIVPEVAAAPVAVVSTPEIVPEVAAAPVAVVSTPEIVPEVAAAPVAVVSTPEIVPEVAAAPVAVVSTPEIVPEVAAAPVAVVSTPEIVPEVAAAPVAVVSTPEIVPEVAAAPVAVVSTPEIVPEVAAAPVAVVSTPEIVPEAPVELVTVLPEMSSSPEILPEASADPVLVTTAPVVRATVSPVTSSPVVAKFVGWTPHFMTKN